MFNTKRSFRRSMAVLLASSLSAATALPAFAADPMVDLNDQLAAGDLAAAAGPPQNSTVLLIKRMVKQGVLSKEDAADLVLVAEADAAEAQAHVAIAQAALAQAVALQARARANAGHAGSRNTPAQSGPRLPAPAERISRDDDLDFPAEAPAAPAPRRSPAPRAVAEADPTDSGSDLPEPAPSRAPRSSTPRKAQPADEASDAEDTPPPAPRRHAAAAPRSASVDTEAATAAEPPLDEDEVRVAYVPEVVKQELRTEIKQDVMEQARRENWASPRMIPDWVTRFRLFGDFRGRFESQMYPTANDNTGAFPNFNAINTGAPFDTSGSLFSPQYNVDQKRQRERIRVRLGAGVDLGENFSTGLRVATGENNSPVTENQSFGLPSGGQGGNFSKYAIWLDRAFLKYEVGGQPDDDLSISLGRFDNPFLSTSMIWADDLGFDGAVLDKKFSLGEDVTPFFTIGGFPVFNTDLNLATNQPTKFKSNDKWLVGTQLGANFDLGKDFSAKIGVAYYLFQNIEGKLSTPFLPLNTTDAGDTDASRPAFAQKGNTYMALRNIKADPLNSNGTIDQFQYYGLASKFRELALTARFDYNGFDPFQVSLIAEYVKNLAFDPINIASKAVNNLGSVPTGGTVAPFLGGNTAWLVNLKVGDAVLQKRWAWNVSLGYRSVASDAVVDGFTDSDFGGGGTNLKGLTVGGNLALSSRVWLGARWMSATQVAGPQFKNDVFQLDLNGKF